MVIGTRRYNLFAGNEKEEEGGGGGWYTILVVIGTPRYSASVNWSSVSFYETGCTYSQNKIKPKINKKV